MGDSFWGPTAPSPPPSAPRRSPAAAAAAAGAPGPHQPVCRHFLSATGCTRPDCAFLHIAAGSASAPVCVFWLRGACRNGAACTFRHTVAEAPPPPPPKAAPSLASFLPPSLLPPPPQAAAAQAGEEEDQPLEAWLLATSLRLERLSAAAGDCQEAFPALPSQLPPKAAPAPSPSGGGGLAARLALDALARAFPGVPPAELRQCLGASQGLLSRACALVAQRNPGATPVEGALHPVRLLRAAPGSSGSSGAPSGSAPHTARGEATARAIAGALDIVETGVSLARLYAACRGQAEALARSRNEAFERSSRAFASNQLAQARAYSAQGQALDRRMREAHAAAAARIFEQRNGGSGGRGGGGGGGGGLVDVRVSAELQVRVRVWDLHGLHAAEAAPLVEEGLEKAGGGGSGGEWVALLTGARNHSSSLGRGGGSLNAGLLEHLRGQGWRVYEPMAGVLCVQL
jgi:hypothetical protein